MSVSLQNQKATLTSKPLPLTAKPRTGRPVTVTVRPVTARRASPVTATARPATARPVTARPVTARPATARPATARPATARPATARPATARAKPLPGKSKNTSSPKNKPPSSPKTIINENLLLLNNPLFFENLRLESYDLDNLVLTEEIVDSANYILSQNRNTKNNFALAQCVRNKLNSMIDPSSSIMKGQYISGIGDIFEMTDDYQTIYLLSDHTHNLSHACTDSSALHIENFINFISQTTTKFVDLFLEMPEEHIPYYNDSFLFETGKFFKECTKKTSRNKTEICVANMRIHWTDIRGDPFPILTPYIHQIIDLIDIYSSESKFLNFASTQIQNNPKVLKELSRLPIEYRDIIIDSVLETRISMYFSTEAKDYYRPTLLNLKDTLLTMNRLNEEQMDNFGLIRAHAFSYLFDLYLLARLFKEYSSVDTFNPPTARFSIVYSGSAHTRVYVEVLKKLGFYQVNSEKGIDESCIKLNKIQVPLFPNKEERAKRLISQFTSTK